jgi:hypothetical protein
MTHRKRKNNVSRVEDMNVLSGEAPGIGKSLLNASEEI